MTIVSGLRNKGGESGDPHGIIAGHVAVGCVAGRAPAANAASRSTRSPRGTSARTRRCRRSRSPGGRRRLRATATCGCAYGGTISFRTPTSRCRWRATRARCSSGMFGQGDTKEERERHPRRRTEPARLRARVDGRSLKRKLGRRATGRRSTTISDSVREIERRVQKMRRARPFRTRPARMRRSGSRGLRRAPRPDVRDDRAGLAERT